MGYQVGKICYLTKQQAENHYYSMTPPTVTQDGKIMQPQYTKAGWTLNGQIIQAALPECEPLENFKDGQYIGWSVFGIMIVAFAFNILRQKVFV